MLRKRWLRLFPLVLLALPSLALADYLEVRRTAVVKAEPSRDARAVFRPEVGSYLNLLSDVQKNGYYEVSVPATGERGWIYRTFVRRYPGSPPEPSVPAKRVEAPTETITPEQSAFAARHLRVGKPVVLYERAREGYAVGYDARLKIPLWVQYELRREELGGPGDRDKSGFRPDTTIPSGFRSERRDYDGSNYDQGHMAPAEDMTRSQQVMDESHILSNIAPQVGVGFNRHIWANLEMSIRDWVQRRGTLTVITGPVFAAENHRVSYGVVGNDNVAVPTHFYKIVLDTRDPNSPEALAFLLPNTAMTGRDISEFLTSIDEIERLTGIDFFANLPDSQEEALEARKPSQIW